MAILFLFWLLTTSVKVLINLKDDYSILSVDAAILSLNLKQHLIDIFKMLNNSSNNLEYKSITHCPVKWNSL